MNTQIKIISQHSNVADAVKAAGLSRPSYENSLDAAIRSASGHRNGLKPCTLAFVVEPFSNAARIYGDKAEVLFVTECDIRILNRLDIGGCIDNTPFSLALVKDGIIKVTDPIVPKTKAGRQNIAAMQANDRNIFATGCRGE